MMDIKGVYDVYASQQKAQAAGAAHRVSAAATATEKTGIEAVSEKAIKTDSVAISAEGAFRSQLQKASEPYAAGFAAPTPQTRIDQLKAAYSGTNTPVSAQQIAGSMLTAVIGAEM